MNENDDDQPEAAMAQWRAAIDRHDDEILALVKSRLVLAEEVRKTKPEGGLAWRPAREARLFARLVANTGSALSPPAVERLWSTIIAQSLLAQGPAFLLVPRSDPALQADARAFFGLLPLQDTEDDAEALARCNAEEGGIAILPAPAPANSWWMELAHLNESAKHGPAVLAALPRFASAVPPRAFAVARAPREHSGQDTAWYVLGKGAADLPQSMPLAQHGDLRLVALDGAIPVEQRPGLAQIGLFSRPLSLG